MIPWLDGSARLVSDREYEQRAYAALTRKYGWRMRIGDFFSKLAGRMPRRVILEIALAGD